MSWRRCWKGKRQTRTFGDRVAPSADQRPKEAFQGLLLPAAPYTVSSLSTARSLNLMPRARHRRQLSACRVLSLMASMTKVTSSGSFLTAPKSRASCGTLHVLTSTPGESDRGAPIRRGLTGRSDRFGLAPALVANLSAARVALGRDHVRTTRR